MFATLDLFCPIYSKTIFQSVKIISIVIDVVSFSYMFVIICSFFLIIEVISCYVLFLAFCLIEECVPEAFDAINLWLGVV